MDTETGVYELYASGDGSALERKDLTLWCGTLSPDKRYVVGAETNAKFAYQGWYIAALDLTTGVTYVLYEQVYASSEKYQHIRKQNDVVWYRG